MVYEGLHGVLAGNPWPPHPAQDNKGVGPLRSARPLALRGYTGRPR